MSTRVYGWEDDPATAQFRFKLSNERAQELVKSGQGFYFNLPDGRRAIQFYPRELSGPAEYYPSGFLQAWRKKLSGYIPVWQMRSQRELSA